MYGNKNFTKIISFFILVFASLLPFYTVNDFFWAIAVISFFIIAKYIFTINGIEGFTGIGLDVRTSWMRNIMIGFFVGGVHSFLLFLVLWGFSSFTIVDVVSFERILLFIILTGISTCFIAFAEEIVIRGFLFKLLVRKFTIFWVMFITSFAFMGYHFLKWGAPLLSWLGWFIMGFYFLIPVLITGSLWLSIGLHWGINFVYFGLLSSEGIVIKTENYPINFSLEWIPVVLNILMIPIIIIISRSLTNNQIKKVETIDSCGKL